VGKENLECFEYMSRNQIEMHVENSLQLSSMLAGDFQCHSVCLHFSKLVISGPLDQSSDIG
jgi:hypothetical protein